MQVDIWPILSVGRICSCFGPPDYLCCGGSEMLIPFLVRGGLPIKALSRTPAKVSLALVAIRPHHVIVTRPASSKLSYIVEWRRRTDMKLISLSQLNHWHHTGPWPLVSMLLKNMAFCLKHWYSIIDRVSSVCIKYFFVIVHYCIVNDGPWSMGRNTRKK